MELADQILTRIKRSEALSISDDVKEELQIKAYKDAFYQFYKTLYTRQFISDFMEDGTLPHIPKNAEMLKYCQKASDRISVKPPYILLTVNIRPDVKLDVLVAKVNKFVKRSIVSSFIYAYEVRKEDMTGLHCHLLCKYVCKPHDFKRGAKSTFKDVCNVSHPEILNFQYIDEPRLRDEINYVKGVKNEKKKEGVKASIEYRKQNNLQDFYESTPNLPCRGAELID